MNYEQVNHIPGLRALAIAILSNPLGFKWSLQGFGMLRLHQGDFRLHVWDSRYAVDNVSVIHDHLQWGLESTVLAGELYNQRFLKVPAPAEGAAISHAARYNEHTILAGVGGHPISGATEAWLEPQPIERIAAGFTYRQAPDEIHASRPMDGTVTLMRKSQTGSQDARVFWPWGTEWVSAEPRAARIDEVMDITQASLSRWFHEVQA